MATFRVERWKHWESSDPSEFYFVPPEIHPYAWQVPRWWYKSNNTVYETCVQVQGPDYIMYIDGFTPAMEFEFTLNGTDFDITHWKDIRRVAITPSYEELLKENGEYIDIELTLQNEWVVRHNTLPDPIIDIPPSWIVNPKWLLEGNPVSNLPSADIGEPLAAICGDYIGGMPPLLFRSRWQVRDQAGQVSNSPWVDREPFEIVTIDDFQPESWWPDDYKDIRFMNQIRDTSGETGEPRNTSKFCNWVPIYTPEPLAVAPNGGANWIGTNVYEVGEVVEAKTAAYVGGVDPVVYQARIQKKDTTRGPSNAGWISNPWQQVSNAKVSFFFEILEPGTYRFQSQAIDSRGAVVNSYTGEKTAIEVIRHWGTITPTVFDNPYDGSSTLTVLTHDPIDIGVSYTGDAVSTCKWSVRNDVPVVFGDENSPQTTATMSWAGMNIIMWTLHDPKAEPDSYMTGTITFFGVDASTLSPDHPLLNS